VRTTVRWLLWAVSAALLAFVALQLWYLAHIWWWRDHPPRETAFMAQRLNELRERNPQVRLQYVWVPYDRISVHLKRAMIAAEDAKFVEHEGFDWDGIQKAMDKNERKGRVVAGGSTIPSSSPRICFCRARKLPAQRRGSTDHADARVRTRQAAHLRDLSQRDRVGERRLRG
jgi:membrane carboxypeptidase/penicillin-binding protein PbpC